MKKFLLVIKGQPANFNKLEDEIKFPLYEKYGAFSKSLKSQDRFILGDAVDQSGVHIESEGGQAGVKKIFKDTDEVATGIFIFLAQDMTEAIEISKNCPALLHGDSVELYQMSGMG